jgi:DNA-binding transcriptional regulator GbsR (MarR family)
METTYSKSDMHTSLTRLNNAKADQIEFELGKAKVEYLTVNECFGLLRQLRDVALEKCSWQEKPVLERHLQDAIEAIAETVRRAQEQAKR